MKKLTDKQLKNLSRDEAQAMADWYNAGNWIPIDGALIVGEAYRRAEKIRTELHSVIFGNDSPWGCRFNKTNQMEIYSRVVQ